MSNASHLHCSQVPIGNNYIIRMGLAVLRCIMDWWLVLSCEEQEVKCYRMSLYLCLFGVCFPSQEKQRDIAGLVLQRETRCLILLCQSSGNLIFRRVNCYGFWSCKPRSSHDGMLYWGTVSPRFETAGIMGASAKHLCLYLRGLLMAGVRCLVRRHLSKDRSRRAQDLARLLRNVWFSEDPVN